MRSFLAARRGNIAVYAAIAMIPIGFAVAASIEYAGALNYRSELQSLLDGAVLAGAREDENQVEAAEEFFDANLPGGDGDEGRPTAHFVLGDGVLDGEAKAVRQYTISRGIFVDNWVNIGVTSQARFEVPEVSAPCITVLADKGQALLVNSGANIQAPGCEIHVRSQQHPAFVMNGGSTLNVEKLCVKGNQYINNGGTISNLETGCDAAADPYGGAIPEPTVPGSCATSGAKDGANHTINPGLHCYVNFNGSPTITFRPGLHIIRGSMNINSGAKVIAEGVTFYFPDTDSRIQANGNLTMKATAPTSGTYKGILMFEKTSDPSNNANKRQYVFNGSNGEYLEGVVHLPNREVVYNSKTNVTASKLNLVVYAMIINSADWKIEGVTGGGSGDVKRVYLSR